MKTIPPVLVLLLSLLLAGCGEEQRAKLKDVGKTVGTKSAEAWTKVKSFTAEQKDEAVALFDKSAEGLKANFEDAKAKSSELSDDAKKALAPKWVAVEEALQKAKESSKDGWAAARDAFVAAVDAFKAELAKHEK